MRTLLLIIAAIFTFGILSAQSVQQDTSAKETVKLIYPIDQVSDTVLIQAVLFTKINESLVAKEYYIITEYWKFDPSTKKEPQPYKQRVIEKITGTLVEKFKENMVWGKKVE